MKRPILGLLAAALMSVGLFSGAPAQAAPSNSAAGVVTPAHEGHSGDEGHKYSHRDGYGHGTRHHGRDRDGDWGDDHDHDGRGHDSHRRCAGLIVVCLG